MHFYKSATTLDMQSCMLIFNSISDFLGRLLDLDKAKALHRVCTRFLLATTVMSLASMARVLRGPFAEFFDQSADDFDAGVRFVRSCSMQQADYAEKAAVYLERMRKSNKVFRNPDGSINITLRVRNRLSGGPLHDVIRCWQEEFHDSEQTSNSGTYTQTFFSLVLFTCSIFVLYNTPANKEAESGMPISKAVESNTMLAANSALYGEPSSASIASEPLLYDELWADLDFGLSNGWGEVGSSTNWMI